METVQPSTGGQGSLWEDRQTDGGEVRSRNGGRWRVKKKRGKERCSLVGRCVGVAKFGQGGLRKRGINGWKLLIKGVYLIKKSENTNK